MAACSWYGPSGPVDRARVTRATPSAMASAFQSVRSWSLSGTGDPSGAVRAGRRASVSSMRARSPATSLLPGTTRWSWRASRMASAVNSARTSCVPEVAL